MIYSRTEGVLDRLSGDRLIAPLLVLGFLAAAGATGLAASTGKPILIALVVGTVLGLLLLTAINFAVWLILIGVLLVSGPLFMFVPQLLKAGWLFSLLGFFLLGVAILYPVLGRERPPGRVPGFIIVFALFMAVSIGSIVFSDGNLDEGITAIKRYFQFFGLMFLLAVYPFKMATVRQWVIFLGIVAVVHIPFALYQRLVIVPAWEYLNGVRGFVALDIVVGAFEGTLGGGGSSSVLAYSSLLAMTFVICAYREKLLSTPRMLVLLLLVLSPLAMGETKIVVVWLPMILLAISFDLVRKRPIVFMIGLMICGLLLIGFVWVYLSLQATDGRSMSIEERLEETIAYNFGRAGYFGGQGLNRTTVLTYWWEHHGLQNPVALFFGHGLGSSYGAGERVPIKGHMHEVHRGQGIGLTGVSSILWDMGLAGLVLYYAAIVGAGRTAIRIARESAPGFDRALCRTLVGAMAVLWSIPIYTDQILQVPSIQVLSALVFGLIAWRSRLPAAPATVRVNGFPTPPPYAGRVNPAWPAGDPVAATKSRAPAWGGGAAEPAVAVATGVESDRAARRIEPTLKG